MDKESNNVCVQIFAKATNTFIYTLPCTCSPKHKIENILKGAVSRLRKIDDSDKKFEKLSAKYKTFLIVINYKPSKSKKKKKKNSHVRNILTEETRRPRAKMNFLTSCNLITQNNPMFPNINFFFQKNLPVLHSI